MTTSPLELDAMRRAIALSAHGLGATSPNPPVGCVILDGGGVRVGEGYHARKGDQHAEVNALIAAAGQARGSTALVTLEPCNHHGRTPPCHQALLDAGISRVLIALLDPTSRGEGGAARLRDAGVDVEVGMLADEARLVLRPWLTALTTRRPQVTWVSTIGPGGSGPLHGDRLDDLRGGYDAVLDDLQGLQEGRPGAHGPDAFTLPPTPAPGEDPELVLDRLYAGGIRTVLLNGPATLAQPYLTADAVDQAQLWLTFGLPSAEPVVGTERFLPPRFRIHEITRHAGDVVVHARRHPNPSPTS